MIVKQTAYMIKCDRCNEYLDDGITEGIPVCFSEDEITDLAYDNGWNIKDGKHYCESCKDYIEREDE